ncbi:MAG: hypothetical protein U9N45_00560, partial [Gemmatimonadota bacterium]|nr:hypothetical protein [Gemmatimonadota bacterium]
GEAGTILKFVRKVIAASLGEKLIRSLTDWIEIHQWDNLEAREAVFFILNPRPVEVKPVYEIDKRIKDIHCYEKGIPLHLHDTALKPREVLIIKANLD